MLDIRPLTEQLDQLCNRLSYDIYVLICVQKVIKERLLHIYIFMITDLILLRETQFLGSDMS